MGGRPAAWRLNGERQRLEPAQRRLAAHVSLLLGGMQPRRGATLVHFGLSLEAVVPVLACQACHRVWPSHSSTSLPWPPHRAAADPFAERSTYKDNLFDRAMIWYFSSVMSKQLGGEGPGSAQLQPHRGASGLRGTHALACTVLLIPRATKLDHHGPLHSSLAALTTWARSLAS